MRALWLIALSLLCGCASTPVVRDAARTIVIVPGAGGVSGLGGLVAGLRDAMPSDTRFEVFHWGAPSPLFLLNLQNESIHDQAEGKLAERLARIADAGADVSLVAHSAGCGVALGALRRLDSPRVLDLVLLNPSVSPGYDLSKSSTALRGAMHVFYSPRDNFWLSWRTGNFGTYDNVKTRAAGNRGFANPPAGVRQYPYKEEWETLGHRGGHFDVLSRRFVREIVAPLISPAAP